MFLVACIIFSLINAAFAADQIARKRFVWAWVHAYTSIACMVAVLFEAIAVLFEVIRAGLPA